MSEIARKYIWMGAAGGILQFALIALVAFSGTDDVSGPEIQQPPTASQETSNDSATRTTRRAYRDALPAVPIRPVETAHPGGPQAEPATAPAAAALIKQAAPPEPVAIEEHRVADSPAPAVEPVAPSEPTLVSPGVEEPPAVPARSVKLSVPRIKELILETFGEEGQKALDVVKCESEFNTEAQRGQYLGLFQMGAHERAEYGHSTEATIQIQSAYRLFQARGWQPWVCA